MVGKSLGPYEILEQLGAGGMGEVYLAEDSRLGRKVAIKVLPAQFAADAERLARFEQEARAAAALSHPNIAVVHDIGAEEDGAGETTHFMVQEYLEGQSLRERLAGGSLPRDEALRIATEIANGLAAAHAANVVHRDLKPDNVFLTQDGHVKILDFGLAKLREATGGESSSGSLSMSPTSLGTVAGQLMGTAAYMSPEQARGESVDQRTDIWAFGVVLYEMLAGERLFKGDSISDTVAAVLRDDIDLEKVPADVPHDLRRLLGRCLERDARRRLHHIADARIEIEDAISGRPADPTATGPVPAAAPPATSGAAAASGGRRRPEWLLVGLGALLTLTGLILTTWVLSYVERSPGPRVMRLPVRLSPDTVLDTGVGRAVTISPDGTKLAFVAAGRLYVRFLDQLAPRELAADNAGMPFFSPDGEWIAFFTNRELRKVSVSGGTPLTLATVRQARGGAWVGDSIVYTPDAAEGLWSVPASGAGDPVALTTVDTEAGERSHRWPSPVPGSGAVLYTAQFAGRTYGESAIRVVSLTDSASREVHTGAFPIYAASGHLLYMQESTLFAVPVDLDAAEVTGPPAPVVEDVLAQSGGEQVDSGSAQFDVSTDGTLVYFPDSGLGGRLSLMYVDDEGEPSDIGIEPAAYSSPRFSPDGRTLALHIGHETGSDVWTIDLERGTRSRLTSVSNSVMPMFSPDGNFIAYGSTGAGGTGGNADIYYGPIGDPAAHRVLADDPLIELPTSFSPNGRLIAFMRVDRETGYDLYVLDVADGTQTPLVATPARESYAQFSPDGRWIAYASDETGRLEIYVIAADGSGSGRQISTEGGSVPRWAPDGSALYWQNIDRMMVAEFDLAANGFVFDPPRELFVGPYLGVSDFPLYDVNPDGDGFVMVVPGDGAAVVSDHVTLVFDFFSVLTGRAGGRVP